jgi:hypothetical protein
MIKVNDALKKAERAIFGTARLVRGHSVLSRAQDAGVTPSQMRSIFTDLQGLSDNEIMGFIDLGNALVAGEINISSTAFTNPEMRTQDN